MKQCPGCSEVKAYSAFSADRSQYDGYRSYCKPCNVKKVQARQRKKKEMLDQIKTALGCMDCGYNLHPAALDFDHAPDEQKVKSLSDMVRNGHTLEAIEAEMDKCDVVCANCHRIRTYNRYNQSAVIEFTKAEEA